MTDLIGQLESPSWPAPARVSAGVLLETGLADAAITLDGPVGRLQVAFNDHGVSASTLLSETGEFQTRFEERFGRRLISVEAAPPRLHHMIVRAVESNRLGSLPIDLRTSTPFQRQVLKAVAAIPPGEVRPYGWVARQVGRPNASRAVGTTMATNPIPVLIPCHRVVRSDGSIGNYLFGPDVKEALLAAEGMNVAEQAEAVRLGYRLTGSATTHITCFPTCRHARRTTDRHRRWFHTMDEAVAAGYRPCKLCRPE